MTFDADDPPETLLLYEAPALPSAGGLGFFFGLDREDMLWKEEFKLQKRKKNR